MVAILQLAKVSTGSFLIWLKISCWAANLTILVGTEERLFEKKLEVVGECVLLETGEEFPH